MTVSEPTEPATALRVRVAVFPSRLTSKITVPWEMFTFMSAAVAPASLDPKQPDEQLSVALPSASEVSATVTVRAPARSTVWLGRLRLAVVAVERVAVVPSELTVAIVVPVGMLTLTSVTVSPMSVDRGPGTKHAVRQLRVAVGMLLTLVVLGGLAVRVAVTNRVLNTVTVRPEADAAFSALRDSVATVKPLTTPMPLIVVPAPRKP